MMFGTINMTGDINVNGQDFTFELLRFWSHGGRWCWPKCQVAHDPFLQCRLFIFKRVGAVRRFFSNLSLTLRNSNTRKSTSQSSNMYMQFCNHNTIPVATEVHKFFLVELHGHDIFSGHHSTKNSSPKP
jgi:hypothetical protein